MSTDLFVILLPLLVLLVSGVVFAIGYFAKGPDSVAKGATTIVSPRGAGRSPPG